MREPQDGSGRSLGNGNGNCGRRAYPEERQQRFLMTSVTNKIVIPTLIALMGVSAGAWASGPDNDGEVTISLMPAANDDMPDAVTNRIPLPDLEHLVDNEKAQESVVKRAQEALAEAETGRNQGQEHGWSHADQGREQGQEMAEDAKARNENRGRSEDRPDPTPVRPSDPGQPDNPGGR